MYLYIDTTEKDSFDIVLIDEKSVIKKKTVKSHRKHSEKLLKSIEQILLSNKSCLKDLEGVIVVRGPGSFTSLRIGIATANALAFGLGISIAGVDKHEDLDKIVSSIEKLFQRKPSIVIPKYGKEPHITESKK